jgi:hypothetical protein
MSRTTDYVTPAAVLLCALMTPSCGAMDNVESEDVVPNMPSSLKHEDQRVLMCHLPSGDRSKAHEILISRSAVAAHLGHGDIAGACSIPESGALRDYVYLVTGHFDGANDLASTNLTRIDVATGPLTNVPLSGSIALAYRNGSLFVARGLGESGFCVIDPDSLAVVRTQTLPWDPVAAVFSSDGRYMYASHGDGYVAKVRIADGVVTSEIQIPPSDLGPPLVGFLALDPAETLLAGTAQHYGAGGSVHLMRIEGDTLALDHQWDPSPFAGDNCVRNPSPLAFDRTGAFLAAYDDYCSAFEAYDVASRTLDTGSRVIYGIGKGTGVAPMAIADGSGQFWATNYSGYYRLNVTHPSRSAAFPSDPPVGGIVADQTGTTIYLFQHNPRVEGVFSLDPQTGDRTPVQWNFDSVDIDSFVFALAYARR